MFVLDDDMTAEEISQHLSEFECCVFLGKGLKRERNEGVFSTLLESSEGSGMGLLSSIKFDDGFEEST